MTRRTGAQYQYEPLVTPESWQGEERRFSIRLGMILDTLHQRIGYLLSPDRVHPVSSVYLTFSGENPGRLFGGIWEAVESPMANAAAWRRTA